MVTLPCQQRFLFGMVLSIYEVFFVANIRLHVIGFFTSLMLKTMPEQQTSASRVGNVAGSRRFKEKEGKIKHYGA